jgi:hypothetical protein
MPASPSMTEPRIPMRLRRSDSTTSALIAAETIIYDCALWILPRDGAPRAAWRTVPFDRHVLTSSDLAPRAVSPVRCFLDRCVSSCQSLALAARAFPARTRRGPRARERPLGPRRPLAWGARFRCYPSDLSVALYDATRVVDRSALPRDAATKHLCLSNSGDHGRWSS